MKDQFEELKRIVSEIEVDVEKYNVRNNRSAGLRIRKSMMDVKMLAQDIRKHILEKKNGRMSPVKKTAAR